MPHVLIAGMGGIAELGLRDSLAASDHRIVTDQVDASQVLERMARTLPEAVVLDLDAAGTPGLAAELQARFPSVTVVACSMLVPRMRVFPPADCGEPYDAPLTPSALAAVLTSTT